MLRWIPENNKDHIIQMDEITGEPIKVLKGNKKIPEILDKMFDEQEKIGKITKEQKKNFRKHYKLDLLSQIKNVFG